MSRFAPIISLDKFKELCENKFEFSADGFDPYEKFFDDKKIGKDISKINFDMENCTVGNAQDGSYGGESFGNYPVGYEVLANGLPVLFVNAGGDWECPICFCIYFDGTSLRGYVPTDGNEFNKKEKCAYGSEDFPEEENEEKTGDDANPELIRKDIINRIQIRN